MIELGTRLVKFGSVSLLTLTVLLSGCDATRKQSLQDSAEGYIRALAHGDQQMASQFVRPDKQGEFVLKTQSLPPYRFSQAEVQTIFPDEKLNNALVTAYFEYFSDSESDLRSTKRVFNWSYDSKYRTWFLADASPFGEAIGSKPSAAKPAK